MKKYQFFILLSAVALIFNACGGKDKPNQDPIGGKGNIAIGVMLPNPDGMSGTQFLRLVDGLQQNVDNSNALPMDYGAAIPYINGNDIYIFPSYMSSESNNELTKYTLKDNQLNKKGVMKIAENSGATNIVQVSPEKAYLSCAGIGQIIIFNPQKMEKIGAIDLSSLGYEDNNPDPGAMIVRDNILYVGLNQMVGGWTSPITRSDVALINTETDELIKMISDSTSGYSFATRPIEPNSILMDENGDIYVFCIGNFGMVPGHKAGILRIKKGETDFDPSYHFTITDATIENEEKTAGYIASAIYHANGKMFAYVDIPGYYNPGEMGHTAISNRAVEIDLYNKTITKIEGLELSNGYCAMEVAKYDDDNYIFANGSETSKGFYMYNIVTKKVSDNPVMIPIGNPVFFHKF